MPIETDYEVLRRVLDRYDPQGWAVEFGVFSGVSLGIISAHMPVIGLDSFDGLPEDWRPGFGKGKFSTGGKPPFDVPFNAMLMKGLFHETLPTLHRRGMPPFGLVHIDCDLYSSTVTALHGVRHHIAPGTVVVFDEFTGYDGWQEHESKAWDEFCYDADIIPAVIDSGEQEKAFVIESIGGSR